MPGGSSAAAILDADGNIDRVRTSDGAVYVIASTVATESAAAATEAARAANAASEAASTSEALRASAEAARAAAEQKRAADQLKNNTDQAQNNAAAKGMTYMVLASGEYEPDAVDGVHNVPTVAGRVGVMYLTPKVDGATSEDAYDQWMSIDGAWELMGGTGIHIDPVTTADVDSIASGSTVTAERVLNATGLTYLWAKLKAAFAQRAHSHGAGDISSGTLPVERGGTGAATAAEALAALGVTVGEADAPETGAPGSIYIKML